MKAYAANLINHDYHHFKNKKWEQKNTQNKQNLIILIMSDVKEEKCSFSLSLSPTGHLISDSLRMISFQRDFFAYFLKRKIFLRVVWERCWEIRFQSDCWGRSRVQVNIIIIVKKMWLKSRASYVIFFSMEDVSLLLFLWLISICSKNCLRLCFFSWFIKKGSAVLFVSSFLPMIYWFLSFCALFKG